MAIFFSRFSFTSHTTDLGERGTTRSLVVLENKLKVKIDFKKFSKSIGVFGLASG